MLRTRSRRHRSEGSAYLITLLSLVVLTMIALALTFTTQTELLVGANERTLQRAFYAAESGVHIAVAQTLDTHNKCPDSKDFQDVPTGKPGSLLKARIEYEPIYPVYTPWCNLCEANKADHYSSNARYKVLHLVVATSQLYSGNTVAGRKAITDMIDVQPWQDIRKPTDQECKVDEESRKDPI